jgi:tetratricopeptide (TPR) repeat protein
MHLASLGLYTLALEDYNEAIRMDPDDSASIFNRAEAFSRLEMFEECVQDLDAYLKLEPKDNDAIKLREKTNRRLHRKRRREDETENDMVTPPQSPKKNDDEKKPCPTTPRSALKKRGENRKKRTC